jgi:hypothetical protein
VNKKMIVEQITRQITEELESIRSAAEATYRAATDEDSKAENKYDTRGLEASYLAGAQAQRVADMKEVLSIFQNLPLKSFAENDPIVITALVELLVSQKTSYVLLMPKGGGQSAQLDGLKVQVITPESPLGEALIGKRLGDSFELEKKNQKVEYEIAAIH